MLLENAKDYLRRAGFRLIRETDDESLMFEGKSRQKGDKFAHKERVANKKQKCCGGKCGKNCCEDDELDESTNSFINELKKVLIDRGYNEEGASSWIFVHKNKIADLEESGYSAEDVVYELDGSLDEAIEDVPGLIREPRGQVGTDDWSDFKDNFRAKTLLLKQVLTPKFVSELIKRTDFSVDEKEIKDYAISVIENANLNAQNPVGVLQRKISRHFTGV